MGNELKVQNSLVVAGPASISGSLTTSGGLIASGSLGITGSLNVSGSATITNGVAILNGATIYNNLTIETSNLPQISLYDSLQTHTWLIRSNGTSFSLVDQGNTRLWIGGTGSGNGGKVGINTVNTSAQLTIKGSGTTNSTTALLVQNANASSSLVVNDVGYIGIGASPSATSPVYLYQNTGSSISDLEIFHEYPSSLSQRAYTNLTLTSKQVNGNHGSQYINFKHVGGNAPTFVGGTLAFDLYDSGTGYSTFQLQTKVPGQSLATRFAIDHNGNTLLGRQYGNESIIITEPTFTATSPLPAKTIGIVTNNQASGWGGFGLIIKAGPANNNLSTNLKGGELYLRAGESLGTGGSDILLQIPTPSGSAGTVLNSTYQTAMLISGSGNIGIGTLLPAAKVHISGSSNSALFEIDSPTANNIIFVSGSGNVGIGTTSPGAQLQVTVGAAETIGSIIRGATSQTANLTQWQNSAGTVLASMSSLGALNFTSNAAGTFGYGSIGINGSEFLFMPGTGGINFAKDISGNSGLFMALTTGNVGIGTTTSTYKLAVSGSGNFTNSLTITGSLTVITGSSIEFQVNQTGVKIGNAATDSHSISGSVSISSSAGSGSALYAYKSGSTVLDIQGSQGQLFSVIDTLSGSLMSVNDISGLPILEVFSDDRVVMGTYGSPALTITGSNSVFSGSGKFAGALTVGSLTDAVSTENTLNVYPSPAGGTGEGGQILLAASGGLYTSASMLDNWQNQFRILKGTNAGGSSAGLMYVDLQSGNTNFVGAVTASAYSGLPNDYLYATRSGSSQTVGSAWANTDIIFNNTVVSKGISFNTSTGIASLTGGKVYRITARLAWGAAASYNLQFSCYTSGNTQIGPTTEIIQASNGTSNISDGTCEFIYAPSSNTDIKIRCTNNNTALSGEIVRADLNTQFIIQQIA